MHQCTVCPKSFPSPSKLRRHFLIHTGQRPFRCGLCWKAFTQAHHLKLHLQNVHSSQPPADSPVRCAMMPSTVSSSVASLPQRSRRAVCLPASQTHLKALERLSDDSKIPCLQSETLLQRPWRNHHSSVELKLKCKLRVNTLHKMNKNEIKMNSFVKQEKLLNPNRQSHKSRGQGSQHLTDKDLKRFSCSICNRSFCSEADLIRHRIIHLNQKNSGNPKMSNSDAIKRVPEPHPANLSEMSITVHQVLKREKICRVPQEAFPLAEQKRASFPLQRINASHQCPSCSKCFPSPSKLRRHMMVHTGERPFSCELCRKRFRQKVHLRVHSCVHLLTRYHKQRALYTNRPPSRTGAFNTRTAAGIPVQELSAHKKRNETFTGSDVISVKQPHQTPSLATAQNDVKTESGIQLFPSDTLPLGTVPKVKENWTQTAKPMCGRTPCKFESHETGVNSLTNGRTLKKKLHTCRVCSKNFPSPYKLSRHLLTHSGVRPYKCSFCSKRLTQRSHLKLHERTCRQRGSISDCSPTEALNTNHLWEKQPENLNICSDLKVEPVNEQRASHPSPASTLHSSTVGGLAHGPEDSDADWLAVLEKSLKEDNIESEEKTNQATDSSISHSDQCGSSFASQLAFEVNKLVQNQKTSAPALLYQYEGYTHEGVTDSIKKEEVIDVRFLQTDSPRKDCCGPLIVFECGECNSDFISDDDLKQHRCPARVKATRSTAKNRCDVCFKHFVTPSKLKRHSLVHTGQRPYNCDICGKTFTQSSHVRTHRRTH